jgi:hypothetical protein
MDSTGCYEMCPSGIELLCFRCATLSTASHHLLLSSSFPFHECPNNKEKERKKRKKKHRTDTQMSSSPYRARLVAFYEKYNPEKIASVDTTLASYKGDEKKLFEQLVAKYGPEPTTPSGAAGGSSSNYRARLVSFYEKYNPEKVSSVDKTLAAYAGREDEMFSTLVAKYGPEPTSSASPSRAASVAPTSPMTGAGSGSGDYKARLTAFYAKYNPEKLNSVDKTLAAYAGREDEMFSTLVAKYGPEPTSSASSPSRAASVAPTSPMVGRGSGSGDYKARLTAFYAKYNPEKISSVDKTLAAYAGREEEMFTALVTKYGPEPPAGSAPQSPAAAPPTSSAFGASQSSSAFFNSSGSDYRSRLTSFYEKYNPEKISSVDKTLAAYAGREEEMFTALVTKYGPEPAPASSMNLANAAPAQERGAAPTFKSRLIAFYEKYNPEKISSVDKTLAAYAGREEEMFTALVTKYGPEPTAAQSTPARAASVAPTSPMAGGGSGSGDYKARLAAFYAKYNPEKISSVDKTLAAYAGREEEMFTALVTKYGPEPAAGASGAPAAASDGAATPAASPAAPASWKARLTAFYEKYAPAKVGTVDATLEKYKGREGEFLEALVNKYGPEPAAAAATATSPAASSASSPAAATPSAGGSYKDRLVRFYEKYAPTKVPTSESTLEKYKGREEELFQALVTKYGPEPAASPAGTGDGAATAKTSASVPIAPLEASSTTAPAAHRTYLERLTAFYEKYAATKVPTAQATLDKYKGREEDLFEALVAKYGPEPAPQQGHATVSDASSPSASASASASVPAPATLSYRQRVLAIYQKYVPARVDAVDSTLAKYAGRENELIEALVAKYGPELAPEPTPTPTPAPAPGPSGAGGNVKRLTAFYEKYAPTKVGTVETTLSKYQGREEELFEALKAKYGPEPEQQPESSSTVAHLANQESEVPKSETEPADGRHAAAEVTQSNGSSEAGTTAEGTAAAQTSTNGDSEPQQGDDDREAEDDDEAAKAERLKALVKEEGVNENDASAIRLLKRVVEAEFRARADATAGGGSSGETPKTVRSGKKSEKKKDEKADAEQLKERQRQDLFDEEARMRTALEDLWLDDALIEHGRCHTAAKRLAIRQQIVGLQTQNKERLLKRYFQMYRTAVKKIVTAKRRLAVQSMTTYQKMQFTPSAKMYYKNMEDRERQRDIKATETRRKSEQEREQRINEAFARGDFVRRNITEASQSPPRLPQGPPTASFARSRSPSKAVRGAATMSTAIRVVGQEIKDTAVPTIRPKTAAQKAVMRQKLEDDFARMPMNMKCSLLRRLKKQGLPVPFDLHRALRRSNELSSGKGSQQLQLSQGRSSRRGEMDNSVEFEYGGEGDEDDEERVEQMDRDRVFEDEHRADVMLFSSPIAQYGSPALKTPTSTMSNRRPVARGFEGALAGDAGTGESDSRRSFSELFHGLERELGLSRHGSSPNALQSGSGADDEDDLESFMNSVLAEADAGAYSRYR